MKKSAYQTKIEKRLAEFSIALDPRELVKIRQQMKKGGMEQTLLGEDLFKGKGWLPTRFYYSVGRIDCQLCGHPHLKRVFVIQSEVSKEELHIGSECATNYLDADVVAGLCKIYDLEYNKVVNPIKHEDEIKVLEWVLSSEGTPFRHLRHNYTERYNLINSGSPESVLRKVRGGKVIGKREREVFAYWQNIYNNQESYLAAEKMYEERRKMESAMWYVARFFETLDDTIFAQINKDRTENSPEVALARANARTEYEQRFVEDMVAKCLTNLSSGQRAWWNEILNRKSVVVEEGTKTLLDRVAAATTLTGWERDFIASVTAYYAKNGTLSPKQLAVVQKIESKRLAA